MRLTISLTVSVLLALPGCQSERQEGTQAQQAAVSIGEVEVQPGVFAGSAQLSRAHDGLTEVRIRFVNRTSSPVRWTRIADVEVVLHRPAGTASVRSDSPGRSKPIYIPAQSSALVSFLFDADAVDGKTVSIFGRRLPVERA